MSALSNYDAIGFDIYNYLFWLYSYSSSLSCIIICCCFGVCLVVFFHHHRRSQTVSCHHHHHYYPIGHRDQVTKKDILPDEVPDCGDEKSAVMVFYLLSMILNFYLRFFPHFRY